MARQTLDGRTPKKILIKIDGLKFRRLLEDKGFTTQDMAEKMGITRNTLNSKIIGNVRFTLEDIVTLITELKVNFDEIFPIDYMRFIEKS